MRRSSMLAPLGLAAALILPGQADPAIAQEPQPGVTVACPRVPVWQVGGTLSFIRPAGAVLTPDASLGPQAFIELNDWVRWESAPGTLMCHTTTTGTTASCPTTTCLATTSNVCTSSGPWDCFLGPGAHFTRQFAEGTGTFPYVCRPHCTLQMRGAVAVTGPIVLSASDTAGSLTLSWSGGSGRYRVYRSSSASFSGACTQAQSLLPAQGDNGTTFADTAQPGPGQTIFYLVMNEY